MAKENPIVKIIFIFAYIFALPGMCFAAPLSHLYTFITTNKYFGGWTTKQKHEEKVKNVQKQIREWIRKGKKNLMCTSRPGWKTLSLRSISKSKYTGIKVDMDCIVEINTAEKVLIVEPGMSMGKLTNILLPKGWTIPVVPELETLTVGGLICGAGIETASHKYGLFADACIEYEVVLPSGEIVVCSKEQNSDLFYAIPWSHGTIGFLTAVKIRLLPATKYIKLEYVKANSMKEVQQLFEAGSKKHEFLEGISFGMDSSIVMYGDFTNEADPRKINSINRWYKPWFYKHVENYLKKSSKSNGPFIEYIPLRQYYHRHTRSYFWTYASILPYGSNSIVTALFGWAYPINSQLVKMFLPSWAFDSLTKNFVLQDYVLALDQLKPAMEFFDDLVKVQPIWLCPTKYVKSPGMCNGKIEPLLAQGKTLAIDIGLYGMTNNKKSYHPVHTTKQMEKYLLENNGLEGLYADNYMTKEEFCTMFDMNHYNQVRDKYDCQRAFPHVYDKTSRQARRINLA